MTNIDRERLIASSIAVRANSHAPFSHYYVGAAVLTKSGKIYTGCNFESVAFGAGVCAERIAIGCAIANGDKDIAAICVCGKTSSITPCGICRQVLADFGDIEVICCNEDGTSFEAYSAKSLLPFAFNSI